MTPYAEERSGRVTFDVPLEAIPIDDEPRPRGGWGEMLKLALSTSGGQKILSCAIIAATVVIVLVLWMVQNYLSSRSQLAFESAPAESTERLQVEHGEKGEERGLGPIRKEIPPIVAKEKEEPRGPVEDEVPKWLRKGAADSEPERPSKPQAPPPMFVGNPNVPADISSNHPDAISSNDEIFAGVSKLPRGKQEWVKRRVRAELDAFIAALKDARTALASSGNGRSKASVRTFAFLTKLEKGRQTLNARALTDVEMNELVRSLIAAGQHLVYISNNGVPTHIPSFFEAPNPAYAAWAREQPRIRERPFGPTPPDSLRDDAEGGGF